jgi:hypothetical protein
MNDRGEDDRADLDASLDAAVRAMTSVRAIEEGSRQRVLIALSEPASRVTVAHSHTWRWLSAAAATLLVAVAMLLISRDRLQRRETDEVRAPSTPAQVEEQPRPTAQARVAMSAPRTDPSSSLALSAATRPIERRSVAAWSAQPPRRPATDRLAETIAALRQLPPELWERPELASIDTPSIGPASIGASELVTPPLEVAPMPGPSVGPDFVPPGGPR